MPSVHPDYAQVIGNLGGARVTEQPAEQAQTDLDDDPLKPGDEFYIES